MENELYISIFAIWAGFIFLFTALLVSVYLFYTHKKTVSEINKINIELNERTQKLDAINRLLLTKYSERRDTEIQLEKALNNAQKADQLKTSFLNNLSHELRTPMNAIQGFSEIIKRKGNYTKEAIEEYLFTINKNSNELLSVMNDMVELSQIKTNQITLSFSKFNVIDLIEKLIADANVKLVNSGKNHIDLLVSKIGVFGDSQIITDKNKLERILRIIIDNAIKFTTEGYIKLSYSLEGINLLRITVEDTGSGIGTSELQTIFSEFHKIETTHKIHRGLGLGLSIAKGLADILKGNIDVVSEVNSGTIFTIDIPIKQDIKEPNRSAMYDDWSDKTFLIVEDDFSNYLLAREFLKPTGVNIIHAANGNDAILKCKSAFNVDLVLMDLKIPDKDGFQATEIIKKFRHDLPVIAVTAYNLEEQEIKAIKAGCDDYLTKPLNRKILISRIGRILEQKVQFTH